MNMEKEAVAAMLPGTIVVNSNPILNYPLDEVVVKVYVCSSRVSPTRVRVRRRIQILY